MKTLSLMLMLTIGAAYANIAKPFPHPAKIFEGRYQYVPNQTCAMSADTERVYISLTNDYNQNKTLTIQAYGEAARMMLIPVTSKEYMTTTISGKVRTTVSTKWLDDRTLKVGIAKFNFANQQHWVEGFRITKQDDDVLINYAEGRDANNIVDRAECQLTLY